MKSSTISAAQPNPVSTDQPPGGGSHRVRRGSRWVGLFAAIGGMAGAVGGGLYLPPVTAGNLVVAACIVAGALGGWLIGYLAARSAGLLFGWQVMNITYVLCLLTLLTLVGGWAGYHLTGGNLLATVGGALLLFIPNLILFHQKKSEILPAMYVDGDGDDEVSDGVSEWPIWMRLISLASTITVMLIGAYVIATRSLVLSGSTEGSAGEIAIRGVGAIVAGGLIVLWGAVFAIYIIFPNHPRWGQRPS